MGGSSFAYTEEGGLASRTMDRRAFIATTAAAGGSLLAGCTGFGQGDGGSDDQNDGDETDPSERIDVAIEALEANDDEFDVLEDDDEADSFDATSIEERADDAETALDEAEANASSEQQTTIETLRATATFQREAGEYGELEVEFQHCLDAVDAYVENDEWQSAADELGDCNETLSQLNDQYDDTASALEDVDTEQLSSDTDIEYEEPTEELWLVADEFDAIEAYLDGLGQFIDGVAHWEEADGYIDQENWTAAASAFDDGGVDFQASASTLQALEDNPDTPGDIQPDVIELRCSADAFDTASDEMAKGCTDADAGRFGEAEDHFDAADQAIESCG